jgi:hypothetical protein
MQKAVKTAATEPIKPAVRQAGRRRRRQTFTVVVYRKKRIRRVVLYASDGVFVFTVPARVEINGRVRKRWAIGGTEAYSARVRAADVAKLIDMYAHDAACRRITVLDPVYRAAALQGYKVHSNKLYVELWLSAPLGEPLFSIGDPRERELGTCIKGFTHSFGIWRMVTPPWCASC